MTLPSPRVDCANRSTMLLVLAWLTVLVLAPATAWSQSVMRGHTDDSTELLYGQVALSRDLEAPVALVTDQVGGLEEPPAALLDLAGLGEDDSTMELVDRLAESEPRRSENEIRHKWLYLVLAWIYEHRHEHSDPLQRVEEVYADFGYPEQVASFVRYMPMVGPDLGSPEANERRLFERWKQYIDEAGPTCSP